MARPHKCRRVCHFPLSQGFVPTDGDTPGPEIVLTVDEYEALRLIDREGLSQEECGLRMAVARTTVQQIYAQARKKVADMLVEGRPLRIAGGDVLLCDGAPGSGPCGGCFRDAFRNLTAKGDHTMRIAVTYENGEIFQHFGHTEQFKVYDIEDGEITSSKIISSNGSGHGALAGFLYNNGIEVLICGGIGGGAQTALSDAGIKLYGGVSGNADDAVQAFLDGKLDYNPDVKCNHHEHEEGHNCGSHGCGNHGCH